eukprot:TRINITY_DN20978_c0_g1_i1.p1 TRINITY_DN20978_c0_g1~~TRINITY_DN20978_c0_g1_i1.p1  ORF type:complete len:532 (+),score=184.25 TRINITY_DN20978_c0_g1_i1:97-1692(+)
MDRQAADMMQHNRAHVPAVCRIPGKGTAFLVSPGLLLTSRSVVATKQDASRMKAVFFEGGKQAPVTVDLQPYRAFFSAAFPDHIDYTLVACDTRGIYNVKPVQIPLEKNNWAEVVKDDTCLIIQHRLPRGAGIGANTVPGPGGQMDAPLTAIPEDAEHRHQTKHFDEVLRVRGEEIFFEDSGSYECAGCPVFNPHGQLLGLFSQRHHDGEGVIARAVHISAIAKHLFANAKISMLESSPNPRQVWLTWYQDGDIARLLRVLQNFPQTEIVRQAIHELREQSGHSGLVKEIVECGGAQTVLNALRQFRVDEEVVASGLRTLWNISFGEDANKKEIVMHGGITTVIEAMHKYDRSDEVAEYGCVLLYNISSLPEHVTPEVCEGGVTAVLRALEVFPGNEVILKFALGVLMNVARQVTDSQRVEPIVANGGVRRAVDALKHRQGNEYLVENAVQLLAALAQHRTLAAHPEMRDAIPALCEAVGRYGSNKTMARSGNSALWYLGLVPQHRVQIVRHGGLDVIRDTIDAVAQTIEH